MIVAALLAAPLLYDLPPAGSYALPVIDRVAQRTLVDPSGKPAELLSAAEGSCTVVSFVYLSCTDANGCPLALAQVQRLDRALAQRTELAPHVRLVTVSFDPDRDRDRLGGLRHHMAPKADWRFLTAESREALQPVLEEFGQDAVPVVTADGARSGLMRHVTKVFLVDASGAIRNIYSTGFLDHRLLLRDVETLLGPPAHPLPTDRE